MRRADIMSRMLAVDLLNRSLLSDFLPVQAARALASSLDASHPPLRRAAMREGVSRASANRGSCAARPCNEQAHSFACHKSSLAQAISAHTLAAGCFSAQACRHEASTQFLQAARDWRARAALRELPVKLERMIHFVPPHIEKLRAKVPELITQVDVVLGNLEDAIPADAKQAARAGFIEMAKAVDFGETGLWTRINALNSPWMLDDVVEIVGAVGRKLDVIMLPKVEGPWDIHYLDQLLAQIEGAARN